MTYQQRIQSTTGCSADEARMVEAWMRLEWGTLDGLSATKFKNAAKAWWHHLLLVVRHHPAESEKLAASYGL